eukprot:g1642.t1
MSTLWMICYVVIAVLIVLVIPFAIFYYESYEYKLDGTTSTCCQQVRSAVKWQVIFLLPVLVILFILYAVFNTARIPINGYTIDAENAFTNYASDAEYTTVYKTKGEVSCSNVLGNAATGNLCRYKDEESGLCRTGDCSAAAAQKKQFSSLSMNVTFLIYLVASLAFVGWFFFVIFGGVGLIALPMDLINNWISRPRAIDVEMYLKRKDQLLQRAIELERIGEMIKTDLRGSQSGSSKRTKRSDKKTFNKYKAAVLDLEDDSEQLALSYQIFEGAQGVCANTLLPWFSLFAGCFAALLSLLWILHICIYMLPIAVEAMQGNPYGKPAGLFLNKYLMFFDGVASFFGTVSIGVLVFYLQLCVIKGNLKVGTRIFIIEIHPMRYGKTLANTFLVNMSLILMCCPAIVQFSTSAFADYVRLTSAELIFSNQIRYLAFFEFFFDHGIFEIILVSFSLLMLLYFCTCGRAKRGVEEKKFRKTLEKLDKKQKKRDRKRQKKENKKGKGNGVESMP